MYSSSHACIFCALSVHDGPLNLYNVDVGGFPTQRLVVAPIFTITSSFRIGKGRRDTSLILSIKVR